MLGLGGGGNGEILVKGYERSVMSKFWIPNVHACVLSCSVFLTLVTPWTVAHQVPSQTGDRTRVLCTGKQILYPSTSREVRNCFSLPTLSSTVNGTDSEQSEKPGEVLRPHVSQKKLSCPSPGSSPQPQDFPFSPGGSSRFTTIRHLHIHPGM